MICSICGKPKKNDKRSDICKSCSIIKFYENRFLGKDFIVVEHSAGKRGTQKVIKYKAFCPTCGKDKGYCFKSTTDNDCSSCAQKKKNAINKVRNSNGSFIRTTHSTPNQGMVTVRSSYEAFYLEYLNSNGINYLYEPKIFLMSDNSTYLPDFYLIDSDEYIEIKGRELKEYKEKFEKFKLEYANIKIKVLKFKDLKEMGFKAGNLVKTKTIKVSGDDWKIVLHSPKQFQKLHGKYTAAITILDTKEIHFKYDHIDTETILHELYHVFFYYCNADSAFLSKDQKEEIFADTVSKNLFKTFQYLFTIYNFLIYCAQLRYKIKVTPKLFNDDISLEDLEKFILLTKKAGKYPIFKKEE